MNPIQERRLLRWGVFLACLLTLAGLFAFYSKTEAEGWLQISIRLKLFLLIGGAGSAVLVMITLMIWLDGTERLIVWLKQLVGWLSRLRWLLLPSMLVLLAAFPLLMYTEPSSYLGQTWTRQTVFLWLCIAMTFSMVAFWRKPWAEMAAQAGLSMAVIYHLVTYFPHVTNYPFALWWSETTRYYLASTFFSQRIYGQDLPWVFRDFTRYFIQAAPFLVPGTPIWVHRLWQVILRFSTGYLTGAILAKRLKLTGLFFWLFSAWAGLYFFQGPVFYNLIVVVMLVFWLVDVRQFWKTLAAVALASIYAGFSRINWIPMAGLMAAVFYFLEVPVSSRDWKSVLRYLLFPAVWVIVGLGIGLGVQQFWALSSGNPPEIYFSSFTSYLLWDRLFPNPSFPIGVLGNILLVVLPMLVYLAMNAGKFFQGLHFIRWLGTAVITSVLFAGGLLVSIKIGGGTNLHNMDVFLVLLLVIVLWLKFGLVQDESGETVGAHTPGWMYAALVIVPVVFTVSFGGLGASTLESEVAYKDLAQLQKYANQAVAEGGEVLFISERHLLTFGLIENVPLVHAHEKLLLQEMAMSKNEVYLDAFGQEMAEQRYAMIVTDRQPRFWKDPEKEPLAMENNVVLNEIVPRLTCAYEVHDLLLEGSLEVWMPRAESTCPLD